jgi:hypothetical protein
MLVNAKTNTRSIQYYHLPADIWGLLIEYIPLYMYEAWRQIPFITEMAAIYNHLQRPTTNASVLLYDAIKRNEVKYCQKLLDMTDTTDGAFSRVFLTQYGVGDDYWIDACRYGRIEILNLFYDINFRSKTPLVSPDRHLWYSRNIVAYSLNAETFRWFFTTYHGTYLTSAWIYDLVHIAIIKEDLSALDWLNSHVPVTDHQSLASDESYFLHACNIARANVVSIVEVMIKHPKVLGWYYDSTRLMNKVAIT